MLKRYLKKLISLNDYKDKMRFIAGPRQSGKTTLALDFLKDLNQKQLYFNWDRREVKERYYKNAYFYNDEVFKIRNKKKKWICFDEIHKMPKWKNILKDIYDTERGKIKFIITGSARLDLFRKSGDSLTGRYYLFHLFPLSLSELLNKKRKKIFLKNFNSKSENFIENVLSSPSYFYDDMDRLIRYSGFPEPLLESKDSILNMWRNNYLDTVIKEDLRELSAIKNLENTARLVAILPGRIGSPLSINSLINDIQTSYPAIKNYLYILELGYLIFKISPYSKRIVKSVTKEQKYYLFDWTRITDQAVRFENYIAFELYNFVTFLKDHGYGNFELYYIRNRNGEETDFLITLNNNPWILFEVKLNKENVAPHNIRHSRCLGNIPLVQLIHKNKVTKKTGKNIFVVSASRFLANI